MTFVIRSMSTTDMVRAYNRGGVVVPAQEPKPYHVYLKEAGKRHGAYWAQYGDIARFETEEAAQAEADRIGLTNYDIAPTDAHKIGFPTYWERKWGELA